MFIVTAYNGSLFGAIILFRKCGPQYRNLNFAKLFLYNGLSNTFFDLVVYLLNGFSV